MKPTSTQSSGPLTAALIADLAAASRILAAQGVVDAAGHVSLRHPEERVRLTAAEYLARLGPAAAEAAVELKMALAFDASSDVRRQAELALSKIGVK